MEFCLRENYSSRAGLGTDPYELSQEGVIQSTWVTSETLKIEAYVKEVCDGSTITGDYQLNGNDLILLYKVQVGPVVTACRCTHQITYEISDLDHQDCSISIRQQPDAPD